MADTIKRDASQQERSEQLKIFCSCVALFGELNPGKENEKQLVNQFQCAWKSWLRFHRDEDRRARNRRAV
jgi:hypothetical protein